jgi:hypothetical protein
MTAPTLDELRRLRCELAPSKLAVSTAVKALLDCEIARREGAGGSEDGLSAEQLIVRQYERLRAALENEPLADNRMGESTIDAQVRAAIEERDSLRAKLAAAEKERDAAINRADSYACERCGIRTGIDAVVPHDVWNKLSPNSDETGLLCLWCMDSIAAERGIVAEVELHWGGGRALKQADAAPSTVAVDCLRQTIQHLAAKLKDAERKRDQWEAEYDARRAAEKAKP